MRARGLLFWLVVIALGLPALLLSVLRITEPGGGREVRLESFTPLALPAYAVLLVLLLGSLVIRGRRRWARGLLAVVAAAGLGLHAWWLSPLYLGDTPAPAAGASPIVVMNSNLYEGAGDAIELVSLAADNDADVLVVEEITDGALTEMDSAGLAALLPYRIGFPDGTVAGTMVFSREPLGEPVSLRTRHQSWQVSVGGSLTLLAVHPVAPVTVGEWREDHERILSAAEASDADLIVGDFNATPDHAPMRALHDAGFRDSAELADDGWQPTWPANGITPVPWLHIPAVVQIDHVLLGPTMTALGTRTVELPGTDHRVVVAEVAPR